jgi:hypothetical protein
MKDPILVWAFYDAPGEVAKLSPHGGDEDWVIFVPVGVDVPEWVDRLSSCGASRHETEKGLVFITAHA